MTARTRSQQLTTSDRRLEGVDSANLRSMLDRQTDLVHYAATGLHTTPETDLTLNAESNSEAWKWFFEEHLYDTSRLTLEHFHLFEWFPLAPGLFHTSGAKQERELALYTSQRAPDGTMYYDPYGKANMLRGGIGAVRLLPRTFDGGQYYFMTASSTGVCHEGFPVVLQQLWLAGTRAH